MSNLLFSSISEGLASLKNLVFFFSDEKIIKSDKCSNNFHMASNTQTNSKY